MNRWPIHIWLFTALVVSLYLPYFFSSTMILLFVLYALIRTPYRKPRKRFSKRYRLPILFSAYFLVAMLSIAYSDNKAEGWEALGNLSSFLVLPWAIVSFSIAEQQQMLRKASQWFIITSLMVGLYFYAAFTFLNTGVIFLQMFFSESTMSALEIKFQSVYTLSAGYMHPGYLSLYMGVALMMSLSKAIAANRTRIRVLYFLATMSFFGLMLLIQSRMTLISLVLVSFLYIISLPRIRKFSIPLVGGFILLSWLVISLAPEEITGRYAEFDSLEYDKGDQDFNGITVRMALWDEVFQLIKESPVLGLGIGDFREEIISQFHESGFNEAILNKLDPHNQYITTWASMGIAGLLLLLAILYNLIVPAYRKGQRLAFALGLFVALACISESILIRHWGIVMLCSMVFISSNIPLRKKEEYAIEKAEK